MNNSWIILINAINIFPVILVSSSMKLVLSQVFKINLTYSTIVSYAGIISALKFLWINKIKSQNLWNGSMDNYKQWAFAGSFLMTFTLLIIYGVLWWNPWQDGKTLAIIITILSTILLMGDIINETAISIFYSHYKDPQVSSMIFTGHKISAFLAYFLFPLVIEYIGFHIAFISYILLSFIVNFSIFYLPSIGIIHQDTNGNILDLMIKDLKEIPKIFWVILFVMTCQMGTLIINGMKCNFIAVHHNKLLSYLLRGFGLLIGTFSGISTQWLKKIFKSDDEFFLAGGILHLLSVGINWWAFSYKTSGLFIMATLFENINKGFIMAVLTRFFIQISYKKPHILTFFWGLFSLLRSLYGGMSGYLISSLGINNLFSVLLILAFLPIIIPLILKNKIKKTVNNQ